MKRNGWYWFGRLILWIEDRADAWAEYLDRVRDDFKTKKN